MSDGLSDVARDERRTECFYGYLEAIITYLKNPTDQNLNNVVTAARTTDSMRERTRAKTARIRQRRMGKNFD